MTIENAKKKTCPMAYRANRELMADPNMTYFCVANECMIWRYYKYNQVDGDNVPEDTKGYCGFGGKE